VTGRKKGKEEKRGAETGRKKGKEK